MSATLTITKEIMKVPQIAAIIIKVLPMVVEGKMSPYPTVVIEITMHQMAEKYVSKSCVPRANEQGPSKIRRI